MAMSQFVDRVVAARHAGAGGNGCASVHREKFKPLGGPDGGNGGQRRRRRPRGRPERAHAAGLPPPPARRRAATAGRARAATATAPTARTSCCSSPTAPSCSTERRASSPTWSAPARASSPPRAAAGGLGNAALANPPRKAPGLRAARRAGGGPRPRAGAASPWPTSGWSGSRQRRQVLAGRGAVGGPAEDRRLPVHHAGAQPRRGQRRRRRLHGRRRARADPRRAEGRGLGLEFLRHVERCAVLVHVVDCATLEPGRDPVDRHRRARATSSRRYTPALGATCRAAAHRRAQQDRRARRRGSWPSWSAPTLGARGWQVFAVSSAATRGPARADVRDGRAVARVPREPPSPRRRASCCGPPRSTTTGSPSRATRTTPTRFHRARARARALGPPDRLHQRRGRRLPRRPARPARRRGRSWPRPGPAPGDPVTIGAVTFDWEPTTPGRLAVAARPPLGGRGTDNRLEQRRPRPRRAKARAQARAPACPTQRRRSWTDARQLRRPARDPPTTEAARRPVTRDRETRRRPAGRRQGRVVVADHASPAGSTPAGSTRWSTRWPGARAAGRQVVLVSSGAIAAGLAPLGLDAPAPRPGHPAGRGAASGSCCWRSATPTRSPGTGCRSARCCSPPTT